MLMQRDREILRFVEEHGSITINQCSRMFYSNTNHSYDLARKRLKKIFEMCDELKEGTNIYTKEKIYFYNKKPSPHNVYILDFYSHLIQYNVKVLEYKREPQWMGGKYRSDAFFKIRDINGKIRILCLEVDFTSNTRMEKYVDIFNSNEIQNIYGGFPMIVIMSDKGESDGVNVELDIRHIDYKLVDFNEKILSI